MNIEEAEQECKKIIKHNKQIVIEARKIGDINTMGLIASIDRESIVLQTLLNELETQSKMIDLMSEKLTTPIHGKEWVKEYYKEKVKTLEKCEK